MTTDGPSPWLQAPDDLRALPVGTLVQSVSRGYLKRLETDYWIDPNDEDAVARDADEITGEYIVVPPNRARFNTEGV
ncbi:hypothetical protein [Streptomyces sp.]|uniref:hypothetical protein n=1 Tax=Streptomyces sp. TaxID=1931 RepID=UPI002F91E11A